MLASPVFAQTYQGTARVVDGDTIDLGLSYNIRIHGIDAPERRQKCGELACGKMARAWLKQQADGKLVRCERTAWDRRYGRPVARCALSDGRDLGQMMVAAGMAWAYLKYADDYALDEKTAALQKRGFWAYPFEKPSTYRTAVKPASNPARCVVKGNISPNTGERIYHIAGQQHYNKVGIDPSKGEACFQTEAAARAAGWRKARR